MFGINYLQLLMSYEIISRTSYGFDQMNFRFLSWAISSDEIHKYEKDDGICDEGISEAENEKYKNFGCNIDGLVPFYSINSLDNL